MKNFIDAWNENGDNKTYSVYELFDDGKKFELFSHNDKFTCFCWMENHKYDCTQALRNGKSILILEENK